MRLKFTFSSKVFDSCANKLVGYFETLPVATRFNPEPMVFLIEVNFRKVSKIGTMLSKIKKVRKLWHICSKLNELHPTFSAIAFWIPYCLNAHVIWSSILQKFSWFEQSLGLVCQTTCFFAVSSVLGCFWGQLQQKMQISQNCLVERPGVYIFECFEPFYARK